MQAIDLANMHVLAGQLVWCWVMSISYSKVVDPCAGLNEGFGLLMQVVILSLFCECSRLQKPASIRYQKELCWSVPLAAPA